MEQKRIIEGWDINCSSYHGISIHNVGVYFIIRNCYIHHGGSNYDGIVFYNVRNGKIDNNTITNNRKGILFAYPFQAEKYNENCEHNIISNNTITFSNHTGIYFEHLGSEWHQHNLIIHNDISYNGCGIYMIMSDSNQICYNNFVFNNWSGVFFNQCMGGGEHNRVYHNNFIENGLVENGNVIQAGDVGLRNYWNESYPSGGNYWSDYSGTDFFSGPNQTEKGSDGIGDSPYEIRNDSLWLPPRYDSYPLMEPVGTIDFPLPPTRPMISGLTHAKQNQQLQFNISSIDPNHDPVIYKIDWGDGTETQRMGPFESGAVVVVSHSWGDQGIYDIKVQVKQDSFDGEQSLIKDRNHTLVIFPESAIKKPIPGLYIYNTLIIDYSFIGKTAIVLGDLDVKVEIDIKRLPVEKVEVYLDDEFQLTIEDEPFVWTWNDPVIASYELKTIIYSENGYNMSYVQSVWKFF